MGMRLSYGSGLHNSRGHCLPRIQHKLRQMEDREAGKGDLEGNYGAAVIGTCQHGKTSQDAGSQLHHALAGHLGTFPNSSKLQCPHL